MEWFAEFVKRAKFIFTTCYRRTVNCCNSAMDLLQLLQAILNVHFVAFPSFSSFESCDVVKHRFLRFAPNTVLSATSNFL